MNNGIACGYSWVSLAIYMAIGIYDLRAQSSQDLAWKMEASSRLKAIYERGEFRAEGVQAEWLF